LPHAPNPPHLIQRRKTWFARLGVPADVRHIIGRNIFIASTHEVDPSRANAVAAPMVVEWRKRIEDARRAAQDPLRAEVEKLTHSYRRYRNTALNDAGVALVADVVEFIFERFGGFTPEQRRKALTDTHGEVEQAMRSLPEPAQAEAALGRITGNATPILAHLEEWKAVTHLKGKSLGQSISAINKFAKAVGEPMERLQGGHVQKWIDGLLRPKSGEPVTAATVNSYLSGIRTYWEWMQSHDIIPAEQRPFWGRKVNDGRTSAKAADDKRDRFAPADVERLWEAAEAKGDAMLAAAIRIAAYSGMRREGICTLRVDSIQRDPDTDREFMHVSEKTAAGVRDVPIHPAIRELLTKLSNKPDTGSYLIHSSDHNKYGKRGDAVGKRFTRLKQELGFDDRHVFHSIRKTVAHLLETAECPEGVAQDIVGHVKPGMTFGLYSGLTRLDHRARWLETAVKYPEMD
jgi:integrase